MRPVLDLWIWPSRGWERLAEKLPVAKVAGPINDNGVVIRLDAGRLRIPRLPDEVAAVATPNLGRAAVDARQFPQLLK